MRAKPGKAIHGARAKKQPVETVVAKQYPMVHVTWLDASHSGADGWVSKESVKIPMLAAEACGFLVHDGPNSHGEECIALAAAIVHNEDDWPDYCLSFVIPKGMILSITDVTNAKNWKAADTSDR